MTFNRRFIRTSLIMVILGLAMLLAIVASALLFVQRTQNAFDRLVDARSIRSTAADLFSLVQDAETGQRGYLLTGDDAFLEPYSEALAKLGDLRNRLETLTAGRPEYEQRLVPMLRMIDAKVGEMAQTIELVRNGDSEAARRLVQEGFGQNVMNNIRNGMQAILDIADNNVQTNIQDQIQASNQLRLIIVGAGIAIIIVIGGAIYVIMRHVHSLNAARQQVLQLNQDLERKVEERTEDLVRANQEIQRYAYIVTHDLRAPLVNIMGFTSELEMSLKDMSACVLADGEAINEQQIMDARNAAVHDVPEALAFIRSSTAKMDGLISAILKISRDGRRQLKPERIDIKEILQNSAASLQNLIDAANGEVVVDTSSIFVYSDRLALEQIFTNLLDNAIKYRNKDRPLKVVMRAARNGAMLEAEVLDNGRGIERDDLERIFELFRRAGQQNQAGEGIGLAHVRSIARNLGGDISVRSEPGEGSAFMLKIPADLSRVLRRV